MALSKAPHAPHTPDIQADPDAGTDVQRQKESPAITKKRLFTALAVAGAMFGLSACQTTSLDPKVAKAHGLDPEMSLTAKDGGCDPRIENLTIPVEEEIANNVKSSIDYVSGGETCFVTKVFESPNLTPGEKADLEIDYLHGDGSASTRRSVIPRLEGYLSKTILKNPLFLNSKIRIRIIARNGYVIPKGGKTTGYTLRWGTNQYSDKAAKSIAELLATLDKENSAKKRLLIGASGGAQDGLGAVTKYGNIIPSTVHTFIAKAPWGSIEEARSHFGYDFLNAVQPEKYVANIPSFLNLGIVNSEGDGVTRTKGSDTLYQDIKATGKQNVWHYTHPRTSHQGLRTNDEVLAANDYKVMAQFVQPQQAPTGFAATTPLPSEQAGAETVNLEKE